MKTFNKYERGFGCSKMHLRTYLGDGVCPECGNDLKPGVLKVAYRNSKWYENLGFLGSREIPVDFKPPIFHRWIEE